MKIHRDNSHRYRYIYIGKHASIKFVIKVLYQNVIIKIMYIGNA